MVSVMMWLYSFFGLGIVLGMALSVCMVFIQRRIWPLMMINYEDRQMGRLAKIFKCKKKVDKMNKTSYYSKPPVLFYGWKSLMIKPTLMAPPEFSDITMLEGGGNLYTSYSPAANVFLPINFKIDKEGMKLVVRFEILKTWFKTALVDMVKNKLLRPQKKWEVILPIAMAAILIIFMVMMIVVMQSAPKAMDTITNNFGAFVTRLESATGSMKTAAANTQIATPVGP